MRFQVSEFLCQALGLAREDVRLWSVGSSAVLLDDERPTLQELRFDDRTRLLVEVRNADLTWPEEIGALRYQPPLTVSCWTCIPLAIQLTSSFRLIHRPFIVKRISTSYVQQLSLLRIQNISALRSNIMSAPNKSIHTAT